MIGLVINGVRRRLLRTVLTIAGVAIAVGTFTTISGLARGYLATWERAHDELGADLVGFETGLIEMMSSRLPTDLVEAIAAEPGVAEASGVLFRVLAAAETGDRLAISGASLDSLLWRNLPLAAGARPVPGNDPPGMVIGSRAAQAFGLAIGDRLTFLGTPVTITGIADFQGSLNAYSGTMALGDMQTLAARPSSITYIAVAIAPGAELQPVMDRLAAGFPEVRFTPSEAAARSVRLNQILVLVANIIALFSLAIGLLIVVNTTAMSLSERAHEFALLRALGWAPGRIAALAGGEMTLLLAAGVGLGVPGGLLMVELLARVPELAPFLEPQAQWQTDGSRALLVVLAGGLAGLTPIIRAARRPPATLLASR